MIIPYFVEDLYLPPRSTAAPERRFESATAGA